MKTRHSFLLALAFPLVVYGQTPFFETNDPGSSPNIDNVQGTATTPAVVSKCVGLNVTATLSSTSSLGWDIGACSVPLTAGIGTPGGQALNLNASHPSFRLAFGGTFLVGFPGPLSTFSPAIVNFSAPSFPVTSFQMVNLNPAHPDGASLSQGVQLNSVLGIVQTGPVALNAPLMVNLTSPPLCAPGPVSFYGVAYSQVFMSINGVIGLGGPFVSNAPSASLSTMSDPIVAPFWTGAVSTSIPGSSDIQFGSSTLLPAIVQPLFPNPATQVLRFRWNSIQALGSNTPASAEAYYVYNSAQWILHRTTDPIGLITTPVFIGISRGSPGAVFQTEQAFPPNTTGPVGGPSQNHVLCEIAPSTNLVLARTIIFTPASGIAPSGAAAGYNGYHWSAF